MHVHGYFLCAVLFAACVPSSTPGRETDSGLPAAPRTDAGLATTDSGVPIDSGPIDAALPPTDSAEPSTDSGPPPTTSVCPGERAEEVLLSALWSELDSKYAVFDAHLGAGDWRALGERACTAVRQANITPRQTFDALMTLLDNLNDGHVELIADDIRREDDAWVTAYPHYDALYELEDNIADNYLDGSFERAAEEEFSWGRIGNIGYLSITSLSELSRSSDPNAGDDDDHSLDEQAATQAMQACMADLANTSGMIVDLRANEGGWDTVALVVASWFSGPLGVAWQEQERNGPGHQDFTAPRQIRFERAIANAYAQPVIVLTSGGTFSAAEVLTMALRTRANVRLLGERTSGHFSDQRVFALPNGWRLLYSDERYSTEAGQVFEGVGHPVDIAVPFAPELAQRGQDTMLEAALSALSR